MQTFKFRTNIKCGGCIATITPALNELKGVVKWEVDTTNPEKILTLQSAEELTAGEVIEVLKGKGYNAEKI